MATDEIRGASAADWKATGVGLFLLASAIYLLCMIPYFAAYLPYCTTSLIGPPGDNMQDFWNTWYSQKIWDAGGQGFFHTNIVRYPDDVSLRYHTFAYSDLLIIFLIRKLFFLSASIPVLLALHNAMLLASVYVSALGAFYLARRFTRHTAGALLAGFIFGFCPFHLAHFETHMHVATVEFIPFFLLFFLRAVEGGRTRDLAASILFYALSALSSWYFLVYIGYFLIFYYAYQAVVQRKLMLSRPLWAVAGNLAGAALLLSPLIIPMIAEGWKNPDVYAPGSGEYVADLLGYFVFDPYHLLTHAGASVYAHFSGHNFEMRTYLGVVNIALFAWAFWKRKRYGFREIGFLLSGILVFMVFASGPWLHVYGHSVLPLPTMALDLLPFIKNMRSEARAVVFVNLLFGIGAGLGLDAIIERFRGSRLSMALCLSPILLLVFLDFYPHSLPRTEASSPRAYSVLAKENDADFGILDLPRGYLQGNAYMMYQTFHQRPIVGGTLSRRMMRTLNDNLETADMEAQKRQLRQNKVKYIFVHMDWISAQEPLEQVNLAAYGKTYPAVYLDDTCVVLRVY